MDREKEVLRTVITLNLFSALKMMLFPMAIITLYWKDQVGLTLTEILILQVCFSVASVIMEYPSGYISDRLGYRWALILACLCGLVGWSWYVVADSFWSVLGAELVLGVSFAFVSGSDTALLFETLRAADRVDLYTRCDGRMTAWGQGGEAAGALFAGALYAQWALWPFVLQIVVWSLALALCLTLREPVAEQRHFSGVSHVREAVRICRHVLLNPALRSTVIFGMFLGLGSFYMVWLVQPYMQICGVPVTWFGPVWAGANIVVAVCAAQSHRAAERWGLRRMTLGFVILILVAYAGLSMVDAPGGFVLYYLLTAMRGLQGPVLRTRLQMLSERSYRASVLSLYSLVFRLGFVLTGPLLGLLADSQGLSVCFLVLLVFFALTLPWARRIFLMQNQIVA